MPEVRQSDRADLRRQRAIRDQVRFLQRAIGIETDEEELDDDDDDDDEEELEEDDDAGDD